MKEGISPRSPDNEDASRRLSRRGFLKGAAALVASAAASQSAEAAKKKTALSSWSTEVSREISDFEPLLDKSPHMEYWRGLLEEYQKTVRSVQTKEITQDPEQGREAFKRILREHPPCFFAMLDSEKQNEVRGYFKERGLWLTNRGGIMTFFAPGKTDRIPQLVTHGAWASTGNGMLMRKGERYYIATNLHVIAGIDHRDEYRIRAKSLDGPDVGFYEVDVPLLQTLGLDPAHAVDVSAPVPVRRSSIGTPVVSRPFDPDSFRDQLVRVPGGFKEFFGIEHTYGPALLKHNPPHGGTAVWDQDTRFFVGPPGESDRRIRKYKNHMTGEMEQQSFMYGQGCSGAGIASYVDGQLYFEGLLSKAMRVKDPNGPQTNDYATDYSLIGFEHRTAVFACLNDSRRIFKFNSVAGKN